MYTSTLIHLRVTSEIVSASVVFLGSRLLIFHDNPPTVTETLRSACSMEDGSREGISSDIEVKTNIVTKRFALSNEYDITPVFMIIGTDVLSLLSIP